VDKVGIGLLGYGTVGSGVGKLLKKNADDITLATGKEVVLKRVLERDPGFSHPDLDPALVTNRFEDIIEDPEISVVVELIGGTGAALDFQLRALKAGKNVVTANKQLLAQHGAELFAAANGDVLGVAPPEDEGAAERTIGLLVDDLDGAVAELHTAGVETDGIAENARWRYTHFRAPDGKLYELVEERAG